MSVKTAIKLKGYVVCGLALFCSGLGFGTPRLVSTSPQITELLFQLGKGRSLVATSAWSHFPPEAIKLPVIGSMFAPDLEAIFRLNPDGVLEELATFSELFHRSVRGLGIPIFRFDVTSVESLFSEAERFMATWYHEPLPPAWKKLEGCWNQATSPVGSSFLALVWLDPATAVASKTYLSSYLEKFFGSNVLVKKAVSGFPRLASDWLQQVKFDTLVVLSDDARASEAVARMRQTIWPGAKFEVRILPMVDFSRTTLTPLRIASRYLPTASRCLEQAR